jgi:GNAT superfamily N-acetyltransferase
MSALELRAPQPSETAQLLALAEATGLFAPGEVEDLLAPPLAAFHAGELAAGHAVYVAASAGELRGWSFGGPQEDCPDCWEMRWLGVSFSCHRQGVGSALLAEACDAARAAGCARLLVSTSSLPATAAARALYERRGLAHTGGAPGYYGPGDDRVDYETPLSSPVVWLSGNSGAGKSFLGDYLATCAGFRTLTATHACFRPTPRSGRCSPGL